MARIRTIKPEFWQDEKIGSMTVHARLLFIGMWNFADDSGVVRGHPVFLRSQIFPYDDFTKSDIESWIAEITDNGMISVFTVNSENFFQITNFLKHQIINKPSKNRNPQPINDQTQDDNEPFYEQSRSIPVVVTECPRSVHPSDTEQSRSIPVVVTECSRTERERERERERDREIFVVQKADDEARAHEYSETKIIDLQPKKQHRIEKQSNCPVDQIVDLYHEHCPMLPKVVSWNGTGKKSMIQRWKEDRARQSLDWWEQYFVRISSSDFLTGRIKDFSANLNWLVGTQNMEKIINGAYDNRASPAMPDRLKNNIRAGIEFLQGA